MAGERVDKQWQQKGLSPYSNDAILGTLGHYGVATDEAGFRSQAQEKYPLELATAWQGDWKGTGQFARFHWAAAEELTKRLFPDRLMPGDFAHALHHLMGQLSKLLTAAPDAAVEPAFAKVDGLQPKVPLVDGKADGRFVTEVRLRLGQEMMKAFAGLSQELAKKGHVEAAERFATLEEFLFPMWAGVSRALVRAAKGEKAQALADLGSLIKDPSRDGPSKAAAVDALIHLDALPQARDAALEVLAQAEQGDDLHLALEIGDRAGYLMDKLKDGAGMAALMPRLQKLHDRHASEHHH
ncbi:MAG: hypothetical protein M3Y59_25670 [Myxococcota bacterium]|nr:hypothetical protein [Myxococcota bacterium]